MISVTFLKTVTGGDGETLEEGKTYSLNDASANHWIVRSIAIHAETKRNIVGHSAPAHEDKQPKAGDLTDDVPKAEAHTRAEPKAHEAAKKK